MTRLAVAVALAFALPTIAPLARAEGFSGTVTVTSDYVFRGLSQTDEGVALQGELRYDHTSGFYAGLWASNVDFGPSLSGTEVDTFIGYAVPLNESVGFDLQFVRYNYLGFDGSSEFEYNELLASVTLNEMFSATLGYSSDVFASGDNGVYLGVGGAYPLTEKLSLTGGLGRYSLPADADYFDWNIGLEWDASPFTLALQAVGTDSDARRTFGAIADNRVVASVSVGF
jgi:uncharacterized protein (TIGR02001 family)